MFNISKDFSELYEFEMGTAKENMADRESKFYSRGGVKLNLPLKQPG